MYKLKAAELKPEHFHLEVSDRVATVWLPRPERKNPLTFESYAELRDTFYKFKFVDDVRAVVWRSNEGNFCSGGDVHDIIGPLTRMDMDGLLTFTRMTGDLIRAMRACPQPIITAIDGICVGAGACVATGSDIRYGTARSKVGFLFPRVGLSGADMGACSFLPRIVGHGRAAELLYTGRLMPGPQALEFGFYAGIEEPEKLDQKARETALMIADGPAFAHFMTKRCLHQEVNMSVDEALEAEAQSQAICMQTEDFRRAYRAFVNKETPTFEGN